MRFSVAVALLVFCVAACRAADGDEAPLDVGEALKPLSDGLEKAVGIVGEIIEDPDLDNPSKLLKKIGSAIDAVFKGFLKTIEKFAPDLKLEETITPVYETFRKLLKDIIKPVTDALAPAPK